MVFESRNRPPKPRLTLLSAQPARLPATSVKEARQSLPVPAVKPIKPLISFAWLD
jgi:hypothetical protein